MKKIKHKEYEITFDNGTTKTYTEFDVVKCTDGNKYPISEILEKRLEIEENETN